MNIPDFDCGECREPCCKRVHEEIDYSYIERTSYRECVALFESGFFGDSRNWYQIYKVNYEPKRIGDWAVEKFSINLLEALIYNNRNPDRGQWVYPDDFTSLLWYGNPEYPDGQVIMSDTPAEISDHIEFIDRAHGRVLINGLGLGMVANALLRDKPECIEHIDVVDINKEVIDLVGGYFKDNPKITIHHADAFKKEWPDDAYWHCAWHDIWYEIDPDDLVAQDRLHEKYKDRVEWQDSWKRTWLLGFQSWLDEQKAS